MQLNHNNRHRMALETLEDKRLLAGDVTVAVVEGNLLVRGDAESNGVMITAGDAPGAFVVAGLPAGDGPTSINGDFLRVEVAGVSRSVLVGMGEGDDLTNLRSAAVRGNVAVDAGMGNDVVNVGGPRTSVAEANTLIRGRLSVDLGEGHDGLRVGGTAIGLGMEVAGERGDDNVAVVRSLIRGFTSIATGVGDDDVVIQGSYLARVRLGTGAGADQVALLDSAFAGIGVDVGDGDDVVALAGVHARAAWFAGGPGDDALLFAGPNHITHLSISGFEYIGPGGGNLVADADWLADDTNDENDSDVPGEELLLV